MDPVWGGGGGLALHLYELLSEAGGAYWPLAIYPSLFLEPVPPVGLSPPCGLPLPAWPIIPSPHTLPFPREVAEGGTGLGHWLGTSQCTPHTGGGGTPPYPWFWGPSPRGRTWVFCPIRQSPNGFFDSEASIP